MSDAESASGGRVPISLIGGRYLLFSIDHVTYLRREHRICGVLIGSIPQAPQQNVFLGLPLELMPEEVRLLTEKGLAYVVDDEVTHRQGLVKTSAQSRRQYLRTLHERGREAADVQAAVKEQSKAKALGRINAKTSSQTDDGPAGVPTELADQEGLFSPPSRHSVQATSDTTINGSFFGVTPTTSTSLLTSGAPSSAVTEDKALPPVPASYPLFRHLNSKGYFASPGLRFGCQYLVYPGDPLRFHSHFLASHVGWTEELDLMDIVGGGRLGTGVKKGYLIGGLEEKQGSDQEADGKQECAVRTFSIEWAAM